MDRWEPAVGFFADEDVGLAAVSWALEHHRSHVRYVVVVDNENAVARAVRAAASCPVLEYNAIAEITANELIGGVDFIFLAWWPRIVPPHVLDAARIGAINFHPSLLPYNRGKHYNFWTIVEDTPFGVSLHFADRGIDSGDVLFQETVAKTWEDTGGTLYAKAKLAMIELFKQRYADIVKGRYERRPQDLSRGQLHYARELEAVCELNLDKTYTARELLNLLRARTFAGKRACHFVDDGVRYEVRVSIEAKK